MLSHGRGGQRKFGNRDRIETLTRYRVRAAARLGKTLDYDKVKTEIKNEIGSAATEISIARLSAAKQSEFSKIRIASARSGSLKLLGPRCHTSRRRFLDLKAHRRKEGYERLDAHGDIIEIEDPFGLREAAVELHLEAARAGHIAILASPVHAEAREAAPIVRETLKGEGLGCF